MRLLRLLPLLLLTAILVVEPVVHTHPFAGNGAESASVAGPNVCAMCAVAAQQITVVRINIAAPSAVADLLVAVEPQHTSLAASRPLASRAPPLA